MGKVTRGAVKAWGALLATAAVVGTGMAVQAPALADGREVGGSGSAYYLNDSWSSKANHEFNYGKTSDRVYTGDWNGDGKDSLAVRRGQTYYFSNSLGGSASTVVNYGKATDTVLVGDWNGDGKDTLAVRRGQTYYFSNSLTGGKASSVINYGKASDKVLVGDWNADAKDALAVRRGNVYYISNRLSGGAASIVQAYGRTSDTTLVGDWNGDRKDTLGVRREAATAAAPTVAQKEAIEQARSYLSFTSFSRQGLIDQLEYHGYSSKDAEYAVSYLEKRGEVSWKSQAVETARDYLDYTAISRSGIVEQLEYEDFTASQAEYGVKYLEDHGEVNWREQAVLTAKDYLEYGSFSRSELIDQLEYEGFSNADAVYAVNKVGL